MENDWFKATRGLYVHFPLCRRKCPYCGFFVLAGWADREELHHAYWQAVLRELQHRLAEGGPRFHTLYLGGGTPTVSDPRALDAFLAGIHRRVPLPADAEITVEANPESLTDEVLAVLKHHGVNRLSIGAQSGRISELRWLGRDHTPQTVEQAVRRARRWGFTNVNLDLIFGLPGQTESHLEQSLRWAVALEPEHLSVYSLTVEPGTVLWRELRKGRISLPSEDQMVRLFRLREEILEAQGYRLYEVSNFARPGYESRHNLVYWCHHEYLGVGLSAASFRYLSADRAERATQHRSWVRYLRGEFSPEREVLDARALLLERVFLGLRLRDGLLWPLPDPSSRLPGLVRLQQGRLVLTPQGRLLADRVAVEVVDFLESMEISPETLLRQLRAAACPF